MSPLPSPSPILLPPGQDLRGADDIEVGMEMQLVLGTLYEDDENEYMVWKWKPAEAN